MKLEDFKIKKLIDKGSFGKVYLVININDGKEYVRGGNLYDHICYKKRFSE